MLLFQVSQLSFLSPIMNSARVFPKRGSVLRPDSRLSVINRIMAHIFNMILNSASSRSICRRVRKSGNGRKQLGFLRRSIKLQCRLDRMLDMQILIMNLLNFWDMRLKNQVHQKLKRSWSRMKTPRNSSIKLCKMQTKILRVRKKRKKRKAFLRTGLKAVKYPPGRS